MKLLVKKDIAYDRQYFLDGVVDTLREGNLALLNGIRNFLKEEFACISSAC